MDLIGAVKAIPGVRGVARRVRAALRGDTSDINFHTSDQYWQERYSKGGNSGAGSYNRLAEFKAQFLNDFVLGEDVRSVIEFGSGDGAQLKLARYPSYIGVDVAPAAIEHCMRLFSGSKNYSFIHTSQVSSAHKADLSMSLDVIYHLVEDQTFDNYMRSMFDAALRFVIVYSSNKESDWSSPHVRHRRFTDWVERERPDFKLQRHVPNQYPYDEDDVDNTSFADFYVFKKAV